jgi:DNA-binding PadR family transcriptional regulator
MPEASDNPSLSAAAFHILVAVASGSRHGYGIMKEVATATGGEVKLNAGTLYTTIRRLLDDGLIRETVAPRGLDEVDERRRYYAITPAGRRAAEIELARLKSVVQRAAATLRPRHSG